MYVGAVFGRLTIVENRERTPSGYVWGCLCATCGEIKKIRGTRIPRQGSRPCRCAWYSDPPAAPLCACGCGKLVQTLSGRVWAIYLPNHRNSMNRAPEDIRLGKWLRRAYGITVEYYRDLERRQEGKCAICGSEPTDENRKKLQVDHDHETGKVRGLLCRPCNTALGLLQDNAALVERARCYLEHPWETEESITPMLGNPAPEPGTCSCGCGEKVAPGRRFIHNHHFRKYAHRYTPADIRHSGKMVRLYGRTMEWYKERLVQQDGSCWICKRENPGGGRRFLCLDHDHDTGLVRGLLCSDCNTAIASLKESPVMCTNASTYLRQV